MKYSYNEILQPWYPEEYRIITMPPIKQNMYAISNYGNVMNIKTGKLLSKVLTVGYPSTALQNEDNSRSIYYNHILVGYHFIPKTQDDIINNRNMINHKNLIKTQNYVHNLEWVNYIENNIHAKEYNDLKLNTTVVKRLVPGTWGDSKTLGSRNGMARLNENQVNKICKMLEDGYSYKEICNIMDLGGGQNDTFLISSIATGKRWKHISKNYNIPKPRSITNFSDYIIPVCELIEKGHSTTDIISILNMDDTNSKSRSFINRLKRKEIYTDISKNYNF